MRRLLLALLMLPAAVPPAAAQVSTPSRIDAARVESTDGSDDGPCSLYVDGFERGLAAFQARAYDVARDAWREVEAVEGCGPDVAYNLATLAVLAGDLGAAAPSFTRALDRLDAWPDAARALDGSREIRRLSLGGLLAVGARHYDAGRFDDALAAFDTLAARDSLHRDGTYNRALTLARLARPGPATARALRDAATRALAFDPLSAALHALVARGELAGGNARAARRAHARADALPVDVRAVRLDPETGRGVLDVEGRRATPGMPLRIEVTLLRPEGPVETTVAAFAAPAPGTRIEVPLAFETRIGATGTRYRLLPR